MFKNYLKIAWRNLKRNKGYSAINIGGLALGMAVVIMIGLWVLDEFTFNKYHKNHDRIASIHHRSINPDTREMNEQDALMYVAGTYIKENHSDYFEHVLRAWWIGDYTLNSGSEAFTKTGELIENGALEMFSLEMIEGSYASLGELNAIVLSESTAKAIFGKEDPMGKSLKMGNEMDVVVTGVYKDLPKNTRFENVEFFANWEVFEAWQPEFIAESKDIWDNYSFMLFVQLKEGADFNTVDRALNDFYMDYAPKTYNDIAKNLEPQLFMHPMDKWHLYSDFEQGVATGGRITFVWLFIAIGIFVLFLACINFMNLSTARSEKRAKEVGIRKTVGSKKKQLVHQFLSESLLVSILALILAFILVLASLPWFNELAGKSMSVPWNSPIFWAALLSFTLITGLLAGSYPALYLSSFTPVKVLKGSFRAGRFATAPRKVLVVFQFAVSIMLAIGTVIVFKQVQFTQDRPAGYDRNNLLMVEMNDPGFRGKYNLLRSELKNTGVVEEMAESSSPITGVYSKGGGFDWPGKDPNRDTNFSILKVTHDYGKTVGWQFVEGRDFNRELASDSLALVINEAAVKYMGLEDPVGTVVTRSAVEDRPFKIIGVTKDMIMESHEPVHQAIFSISYPNVSYINIRVKPEAPINTAISKIEDVFAKVVPSANFDYKFVDQEYADKFESEQRLGNLAGVFTLLAILISCLGLFGLASFVAEQRTKEIGVRKVLGASVLNLWKMLSKDFVVLVLISELIAIPIAYHFMGRWLEGYEYRMEISWWIFGLAIAGALLITLLTVSFQAIKAANVNPVKSLRTE
jgi:ABC-type antimicrobial peptide transport system permease subunit